MTNIVTNIVTQVFREKLKHPGAKIQMEWYKFVIHEILLETRPSGKCRSGSPGPGPAVTTETTNLESRAATGTCRSRGKLDMMTLLGDSRGPGQGALRYSIQVSETRADRDQPAGKPGKAQFKCTGKMQGPP